jgi:hypothetical protein
MSIWCCVRRIHIAHLCLWLCAGYAMLLIAAPVDAQGALSPNAPPDHSGIALGAGFAPDPLPIPGILGGGSIDTGALSMGQDCRGYVTAQPDFRVNIIYPFDFLRFIFVSDSLLNDTTMIIRSPGGTYRCNQNSFSVNNPSLDYREMVMGEYAIWIGTVAPNSSAQGTLYMTISEAVYPSSTGLVMPFAGAVVTPTPGGIALPTQVPGSFMDVNADAADTMVLEHGFLPDPYWTVLVGGGGLPVPPHDRANPAQNSEGECGGFTSSAPQFRLSWRGLSTRLRMFFIPAAPADADTSLAVYSPSGWVCNRSFAPGFTEPLVEFINPPEGDYIVWVSHESLPDIAIRGVLYVTEKLYYPTFLPRSAASDTIPYVNGLDNALAPTQAAVEIGDTLAQDPLLIPLQGGGENDIFALNPQLDARTGCEGYMNAAPTMAITLLSEQALLRLFFLPDGGTGDATLIMAAPDGSWYCNDDSYNSLHPTLSIVGAAPGTYQVWVGNYDASEPLAGALYLTRSSLSPVQALEALNADGA